MKATVSASALLLTPETREDLMMIERLVGGSAVRKMALEAKPGTYHVALCAIASIVRSEGDSDRLALAPARMQSTMPDLAARPVP